MLPSARARHMTLPVPLTSLVGRQREVELVRGLLGSDARLITILGPGGIGKTRLAIAVADTVVDAFPDARLRMLRNTEHFGTPKSFDFIDSALEFLGAVPS